MFGRWRPSSPNSANCSNFAHFSFLIKLLYLANKSDFRSWTSRKKENFFRTKLIIQLLIIQLLKSRMVHKILCIRKRTEFFSRFDFLLWKMKIQLIERWTVNAEPRSKQINHKMYYRINVAEIYFDTSSISLISVRWFRLVLFIASGLITLFFFYCAAVHYCTLI